MNKQMIKILKKKYAIVQKNKNKDPTSKIL